MGQEADMKLSYDPKYNVAYLRLHEKTAQVTTIKVSDEMNIDIYGISHGNRVRRTSIHQLDDSGASREPQGPRGGMGLWCESYKTIRERLRIILRKYPTVGPPVLMER
jgi:hypothetical protein